MRDKVSRASVGDNDPLPVPPDTIGGRDATNGVAVAAVPRMASVGSDGQARYHIPIWVSPGRAGMQPDIALDYESRGQNGLVGVGWRLSGLSQITRCPKTVATEGFAKGLTGTDTYDGFCLDGSDDATVRQGS